MSLSTLLLIILILLALGALFYRPVGTGYTSYAPSGVLWVLVLIVLILILLLDYSERSGAGS